MLEPQAGRAGVERLSCASVEQLERDPVKIVIRAAYRRRAAPRTFIAERAKIPAVMLPFTVGGTHEAKDLFSLYDDTIKRLLAG